jgi:hypothetical protein
MRRSPNLIGGTVHIPAADHPHEGERGVVIAQGPCCNKCEYDTLTLRLDSGEITTVYEPETD